MSKSNQQEADGDTAGGLLAYSVEEAAKRASIGRTMVYAAIKMGYLKARKVGRRTVVLDSDYRAWLDSLPTTHSAA